MKKKNQTVIATEENVIDFIKSDVYLFIDTLRLLPSMGADSSTVVLSGGAWGEMLFVVPADGEGRVQGKESSGRQS